MAIDADFTAERQKCEPEDGQFEKSDCESILPSQDKLEAQEQKIKQPQEITAGRPLVGSIS